MNQLDKLGRARLRKLAKIAGIQLTTEQWKMGGPDLRKFLSDHPKVLTMMKDERVLILSKGVIRIESCKLGEVLYREMG